MARSSHLLLQTHLVSVCNSRLARGGVCRTGEQIAAISSEGLLSSLESSDRNVYRFAAQIWG